MVKIETGTQCNGKENGKESSMMVVVEKNQIKSTLFDNKIWLKSDEQRKAIMS